MRALRPPGSSGKQPPRAPDSANPPPGGVPNSERRLPLGSVRRSQAGLWAGLPQSPKGRQRGGGGAAGALRTPGPAAPLPARRPRPKPLTAGSCRSCAGCSARAACARTAWLGLRARPDPGARRTGRGARRPLSVTCQQHSRPLGPPAPAHLWTALGAGPQPDPPPGRAAGRWLQRPPHLVTRTGASSPGASAPPGRRPRAGGAAAGGG